MTAHAINKTDKLKLNVETRTLVSTSEIKDETKVYFEKTDFPERLRKIIADESVSSFASKINLSSAGVHKYLKGISEPTRPVLIAMSEIAGVNLEWLATGNGPMMKNEISLPVTPQETSLTNNKPFTITNLEGRQIDYKPSPNLINIPVLSMEAACGIGTFSNETYITAMFSATREWLARNLNRNPDHLFLIQAKGDSMIDTIKPNDMIFVDPEDAKSPSDGIWVFAIENQIFLKRLQFLPRQKLKVISDNPAYETYFLDLDETIRLLARYIATLSIKI